MIQTVTGKLEKAALGKILMHEHVSCASNDFTKAFGKKWLDREVLSDYAAEVLRLVKNAYGLGLFVDGTPIDLGRDVALLKDTSLKSGVPIVASTGLYWFPSFEFDYNKESEIAQWMIDECVDGVYGTDVKPGIIKCAAGRFGMTDEVVKKHAAMGIVQKETGLPVYVHCEHREDLAFSQLDALQKHGANAEKIIIGHCVLRPSAEYMMRILDTGCYIAMDQCFCNKDKTAELVQCLVTLCEKGYVNRILLSNDYCIHSDFKPHSANGLHLPPMEQVQDLGDIFQRVFDAFCAQGGKLSHWQCMTEQNPLDVLDV